MEIVFDFLFGEMPFEEFWNAYCEKSPMEYLGRHKDGELVQLHFRDVDTGEERIAEQFY